MKKILLASLVVLAGLIVSAQKSEIFIKSGVAIQGYDPVAYFTESKPVKGDEKYAYEWKDAKWYFSNQKNLNAFKANPEKYAPQYGGYCAYGMSAGHKATTEPDAFTIVNGKLYLNYNLKVKEMWVVNRDERIKTADKNWETLKDKE